MDTLALQYLEKKKNSEEETDLQEALFAYSVLSTALFLCLFHFHAIT